MKPHTKTIQDLIDENEFTSYLEIGIVDGDNFNQIKCAIKVGVDPDEYKTPLDEYSRVFETTSDEYFFDVIDQKFDLIMIDGLHHSYQVEKDIINSYAALNKGGMILIHDCNPSSEKITRVPRETKAWTGDVFRAVIGFHQTYANKIKTEYLDDPYGLFCIHKTGRFGVKGGFNLPELSFNEFLRVKPW